MAEILCNFFVMHRASLILSDGQPITHKLDVDFLQQYASLRGSEARQGRNCIGMDTPLVEEQVEEIWKQHHNTKN